MSLNSQIKSIVNNLSPDATYMLQSYFNANLESHGVELDKMPIVVLDNTITKDGQIMKNNNLQLNTRVVLRFLQLDDVSNTDEEREDIRQAMEDLALRVLVNMYQIENVRILTGNQSFRIIPVFNAFNTNLTGVMLEVSLNENVIISFCDE